MRELLENKYLSAAEILSGILEFVSHSSTTFDFDSNCILRNIKRIVFIKERTLLVNYVEEGRYLVVLIKDRYSVREKQLQQHRSVSPRLSSYTLHTFKKLHIQTKLFQVSK